MLTIPHRSPRWGGEQHIIHLPYEPDLCAFAQFLQTAGAQASATWPTANLAIIYPFYVWEPTTVLKLGWFNGSSAGGATCVALYDASLARLVTTTATTRSGNSTAQWVDVTDTALTPGALHYAAMSHSATTANNVSGLAALGNLYPYLMGEVQQQASVGTLPDPLVPAAFSAARIIPSIYLQVVSGAS